MTPLQALKKCNELGLKTVGGATWERSTEEFFRQLRTNGWVSRDNKFCKITKKEDGSFVLILCKKPPQGIYRLR